jgi:hypothetical protein
LSFEIGFKDGAKGECNNGDFLTGLRRLWIRITANFYHESVRVVKVNAATSGASDGPMGDRHLVLLKDGKGTIEQFWGNIKG